jgi:hypothetical protein
MSLVQDEQPRTWAEAGHERPASPPYGRRGIWHVERALRTRFAQQIAQRMCADAALIHGLPEGTICDVRTGEHGPAVGLNFSHVSMIDKAALKRQCISNGWVNEGVPFTCAHLIRGQSSTSHASRHSLLAVLGVDPQTCDLITPATCTVELATGNRAGEGSVGASMQGLQDLAETNHQQ